MSDIRIMPELLNSEQLLIDILSLEKTWGGVVDIGQTWKLLEGIVYQSRIALKNTRYELYENDLLAELNEVLDNFYLDQAFSSVGQGIPDSSLNSLNYLVQYHTGESLSMAVLLNHVLLMLDFDSNIKVIDHEIMVEVALSNREYAVIDATTGEQFTHLEHHASRTLPIHFSVPNRVLDANGIMQIFLTQQKLAFTEEKSFDKALNCIEFLIETTPDDPYQRRDRGYLLQQLDCHPQAKDDFEFFISQCPEDPTTQMLKSKIEEIETVEHIFH